MLKVSLRRFPEVPTIGEQFVTVDGEDSYLGTVRSVDLESRIVLMEMEWD